MPSIRSSARRAAVRVLACLVSSLAGSVALAVPTTYVLTPLFPTPVNNGGFSFGYSVNNAGFVAGASTTSFGSRGTAWTGSNASTYLPNINGTGNGGLSLAYGVNNNGWIVGRATGTGPNQATVWKPGNTNNPIFVASPGGTNQQSFFYGINDNNVAAGRAAFAQSAPNRAITWTEAGGIVRLPDRPGAGTTGFTEARDINNSGVIVGETTSRGIRWASNTSVPILLHPFSGTTGGSSEAWAVNNLGVSVGWGTGTGGGNRPMMWSATGVVTQLATTAVFCLDINDFGTIVGQTNSAGGKTDAETLPGSRRGLVYNPGDGFRQIDSLIDPSTPNRADWSAILEANSVNNLGQITGFGIYKGASTAYIATPIGLIPEPGAALGLVMVAGTALLRRRGASA